MMNNGNVIWNRVEYDLISIKKIATPDGLESGPWYEYILGRGDSCLVCKRKGTLEQVREHALELAIDLNTRRRMIPFGYGRRAAPQKH